MRLRADRKYHSGETFGRWLAMWPCGWTPRSQLMYICQCECGTVRAITEDNLVRKMSMGCGSCGARTHCMTGSPEYRAWAKAKDRCRNPRCTAYPDYGARGIQFLFDSFEHWYSVLGPRPEGHSVDRINNDGNYEPGNVRWATSSQQNYNRRPRCA